MLGSTMAAAVKHLNPSIVMFWPIPWYGKNPSNYPNGVTGALSFSK